MLLTGTFNRSVDDKLRVAIPKGLREALDGQPGIGLYVAPGTDGSLAIYSETSFASLGERFAGVSPTQQNVRAFTRLFYARAQRVELDKQGRVRIPPELAELAGLGREAVLLGVQDHLELWAVERWRQYLDERQGNYDEIAEAAFDAKNNQ
ncbi:MAG TPA: division/cell wall cluster transcriptional repressor MraZ [Planctomycetaceae bacterium]|nr:division/cell wall cluster transcriptional repressor MraZ [Planctomycetaceae bacterium]